MRALVAAASRWLLALLLLAAAPRAGRAADEGEARAHFDAGVKAFDGGEYELAVSEFQTAYRLKPHPDILINIATSYERLYRPSMAREAYERFLLDAPQSSDLRALAEKRLRVLRVLPGSILVDAGKPGAAVTLTGAGNPRHCESRCQFTDLLPGAYHVHVAAAGYLPIDEDVTLAPNESHAITQHLQREMQTLTILSVPGGARVFIDNQDTGEVTPFSRAFESGAHIVRLELPDRPPRVETVNLEAGRAAFLRPVLQSAPRSGRAEMVLASMVLGGYAGGALTVAIGGNRVTTGNGIIGLASAAVGGIGIAGALAYALTDENMKVGHSSIIAGSALWGVAAGTSLALGLGLNNRPQVGALNPQQDTLALSLLGGGLGLGAGIVTAWLNDTSPGDAAIVNSGALWGFASTALLTEAISFRRSQHDAAFGWLTLGGNALGLTGGALLAWRFEVSRAHIALIDLGGVLGGVLGYGIGLAAGNDSDPAYDESGTVCFGVNAGRCVAGARYALGGMALGLLTAAILARKYDVDVPKMEAFLRRHEGRWAIGLPALRLGAQPTARGLDQRLVVDLARGEW